MNKLSNEQILEICTRYQQGESSEKLAHEFSVSPPAIRGLLDRRGIQRRSKSDSHRKYECNQDFFASIDNQEKSYWLGFLSADGFIRSDGALTLHLASVDESHMRTFVNALQSTHPITHIALKGRSYSKLYIQSTRMCEDLAKWGVTYKKTFTLQWPALEDDLMRHFLRGYADGDGGFYLAKTKYPTPNLMFSMTSNEAFIQGCQDFLSSKLGLGKNKHYRRHPGSAIDELRYGGTLQVARIARFLYQDATICLERKRKVVERFL